MALPEHVDEKECNYEDHFASETCIVESAALVDEDEQFQGKHQPTVDAVKVEALMKIESDEAEFLA